MGDWRFDVLVRAMKIGKLKEIRPCGQLFPLSADSKSGERGVPSAGRVVTFVQSALLEHQIDAVVDVEDYDGAVAARLVAVWIAPCGNDFLIVPHKCQPAKERRQLLSEIHQPVFVRYLNCLVCGDKPLNVKK